MSDEELETEQIDEEVEAVEEVAEETTEAAPEEVTKEEAQDIEDAAFAAVFDDEKTEDEPEAEPEKEAEPEAEKEPEAESKPEDIIATLQAQVRQLQGRYGEINSKLTNAASKATKEDGHKAPTKAQISEALADGEKFKVLNGQFPEWGEAQLEMMQELSGRIPDVEALKAEMQESMQSNFSNQLDVRVLDITHKGWNDTINSPEFLEFAYQGGPTPGEYKVWVDSGKDAGIFKSYIDAYPEWGEKYGELLDSDDISDAATLLDQFKESRTAQEVAETKATNKKARLVKNVAATKSTSKPTSRAVVSEQDAFDAVFAK